MKTILKKKFLSAFLMLNAITPAWAINNVDILVLYTPGVAEYYANNQDVRFEHLANVANQVYLDSGVDMSLRIVGTHEVDYPDLGVSSDALEDMTNGVGDFADIADMRTDLGADLVILYRPYDPSQNSCGIAWLTGAASNGDFGGSWERYGYSLVSVTTCADYTTTHEIGHNSGLVHSRAQGSDNGTFSYSMGHGVDGMFTTIMAYQSAYNVGYWSGKIYKFSSPDLDCLGAPCGFDRNDPHQGADAVYSLNLSMGQIKNWREEIVPYDIVVFVQRKLELLDAAESLLVETKAELAAKQLEQADKLSNFQVVEHDYHDELEAWWYEAFKEQHEYKLLDEATKRYADDPTGANKKAQQAAIDAVNTQRNYVQEITTRAGPILTPLLALTKASNALHSQEELVADSLKSVESAENAYQEALKLLTESLAE
ncbi:MAG: zinc-dependent metalloprotease [Pseudomonadales bacterium]